MDCKIVKRRKKYDQSIQKQLIILTSMKMKRRNGDVMIVKKSGMKVEMIDGLCVICAILNSIYSVMESAMILNSIGILL